MNKGFLQTSDNNKRKEWKIYYGNSKHPEDELKSYLINRIYEICPEFKYLIDFEWEVEKDYSNKGKGYLIFGSDQGAYLIIETKFIHPVIGRNIRVHRNYAKRTVREYREYATKRFGVEAKVIGATFTNEDYQIHFLDDDDDDDNDNGKKNSILREIIIHNNIHIKHFLLEFRKTFPESLLDLIISLFIVFMSLYLLEKFAFIYFSFVFINKIILDYNGKIPKYYAFYFWGILVFVFMVIVYFAIIVLFSIIVGEFICVLIIHIPQIDEYYEFRCALCLVISFLLFIKLIISTPLNKYNILDLYILLTSYFLDFLISLTIFTIFIISAVFTCSIFAALIRVNVGFREL